MSSPLCYSIEPFEWVLTAPSVVEAIIASGIFDAAPLSDGTKPGETFEDWCWWAFMCGVIDRKTPSVDKTRNKWLAWVGR